MCTDIEHRKTELTIDVGYGNNLKDGYNDETEACTVPVE